jgi:thymidylate synthase ThyX
MMHFISLRADDTAQYEIRQYALALDEVLSEVMPVTHAAFNTHGRMAP